MKKRNPALTRFFFLLSLCVGVWVLNLSCSSKPTDVRTVIPADALVYLETNDLGKTVGAITESEAFARASSKKPDLSAINGVRVAVAVTGFQTAEQDAGEDKVIGKIIPHFVAVAETNAWSWQTTSFAENKLGEFINDVYGGAVELNVSPKNDGKYFVWTAQDGRKAYALVQGSVIYFGNDESSIEKCQAVKRGETESIAKNPKITSGDRLAFGYISPDGVAQIANIAGTMFAGNTDEDSEIKSFVARVLPEILRNSVSEATWTATSKPGGQIEDSYSIALKPEIAKTFSENFVAGGDFDPDISRFLPAEFVSTTRYNFRDPRAAWNIAVRTAQSSTDAISGNLIGAFSGSLFEPYGVEDPELFLKAAGNVFETAAFDADGDDVVIVARVNDFEALRKAVAKEINFAAAPEKLEGADVWRSADGEIAFAIVEGRMILGDAAIVSKCLKARNEGTNLVTVAMGARLNGLKAPISTVGTETDPAARLAEVLGERKNEETPLSQRYDTETSFDQNGIQRRSTSDFGLIGTIIEQFRAE